MKKFIFIFLTALLTACSHSTTSLVRTADPILNVELNLFPYIDVDLHPDSATITNKSQYILPINYIVAWYNQQGVTQLSAGKIDDDFRLFRLNAGEKTTLIFPKPTPESLNYRLYMTLKKK